MFRRLVATSRAPQIMVLSMLRSHGKIGPQIDQIWAWLSRGHRWSPGVRNPPKSSVTGPSLLVNCYLEIKFHKIIRVNPPPPLKKLPCNPYQNSRNILGSWKILAILLFFTLGVASLVTFPFLKEDPRHSYYKEYRHPYFL